MSLTTSLRQCLTSISLGGVHALIAIGYALIYGILRLINFARGNIFVMAGYFMMFAMASPPWLVAIPVTPTVTTLLSVTIERVAYRPLRSAPRISVMISIIGVPYLLRNLTTYLFIALPKGYPEIPFLKKVYRIGGLSVSFVTFPAPVLTLVLVYLLTLLINHTKIGIATRTVSKDYETAPLMSIRISKTIAFISAAGSLLAGIGPILYFTDRMTVFPFSGALPGLKYFVAVVLGGIGSTPEAVIGGFILGFGEMALVAMGQPIFSDAFTFILLIVMPLIRPTGLSGKKTTDRVRGDRHEEYDKKQK